MVAPLSARKRRRKASLPLAGILTLLIVLPVLLFSGYELASMSSTERMLTETYNRQLDGALTSLNQYAWDLLSIWTASMSRGVIEGGTLDSALALQLERHPSVDGAFLADSTGSLVKMKMRAGTSLDEGLLEQYFRHASSGLGRMLQLRQSGYTKLLPQLLDSAGGDMRVLLLFPVEFSNSSRGLGGILIEPERFSREVLGPKLSETAGNQLIAAVFRKGTDNAVFTTDEGDLHSIVRRRALWIFPRLEVGIRFRGDSAEDLASTRSRQLIIIIVALDLLLLTGAWLTYRNVRRESELAKLKSDFVSNVSHELRTPLALIRMYAETLELGRLPNDAKKQEYYATIVSETARLTRLVNNILNFSRLEAGRMPFTLREANLNSVVTTTVDVWRELLQTEHVELVMNLDEHLPSVRLDGEAIGEALMNLIDNGVKYGGESKFLGIATGSDTARVFVSVEDRGAGILRKDLHKVFEMFYRTAESSRQAARGSGVGLAIVRNIMDAHGGTVTVESAPGKGSTFTLWLPKS
ncbi:MAG TPA: HAMP domain-containing sensor histidine kinase [Bacteroidota bacterium]|nr:HAMP domain-containing sensor histidine kinase [Bacteroidota bacterium]